MAKRLYHIGIDKIKTYILNQKSKIAQNIHDKDRFEISKVFGRTYYEVALHDFCMKYKIDKNIKYQLQVINIFKSSQFITDFYNILSLTIFEEGHHFQMIENDTLKDYQKSIFYIFIYFLHTNVNESKKEIADKLLSQYFFHHLSTINKANNIVLNYQNMTRSYIKGKNIVLKESYKIDENVNVNFKIFVNQEVRIDLNGKSVKTLRKKAYKKIFFELIDSYKSI
jgi:hypothetical protein